MLYRGCIGALSFFFSPCARRRKLANQSGASNKYRNGPVFALSVATFLADATKSRVSLFI